MSPANAFIKGILKGPPISVLAAALTSLTDSQVKTLQAGQTFVANTPAEKHGFGLWSTGRDVRQALRWPTFLAEEPLCSGIRVAEMFQWYTSREKKSFKESKIKLDIDH